MKNDAFPTVAMVKKYIDDLSVEERAELLKFSTTGKHAADQITRARIGCVAKNGRGLVEIVFVLMTLDHWYLLHELQISV